MYFNLDKRTVQRSHIIKQCSDCLSTQNSHWSYDNVKRYFYNHQHDIVKFLNKPIELINEKDIFEQLKMDPTVLALPLPDQSDSIHTHEPQFSEDFLNELHTGSAISKRFPFIRFAPSDGDISRIFSKQNYNNTLPLNASNSITYLDTLLMNFDHEETNLLDQIPNNLTILIDEQIVFILDQLTNKIISQRQVLRHFGVTYYSFKRLLRSKGLHSGKLVQGRLESCIMHNIEEIVINYRHKFHKGYQSIYKALKLKGLRVTDQQIRKIFKKNNLWTFHKAKQKKQLHNKRYVALYSNMEWHIDLHYWNTFNENSEVISQYLFAVIDDLTRYLLFTKVLENKSMESTGMALMECIETTQCKPYIIATDNGKEFTGNFFEEVLRKHHINHYYTHPYTPEENAKLERWWGTLEGAIIQQEDLELLVKEYNFNWAHKDLERMTGKKMTPAEAWKRFKRYEGIPEEKLLTIIW
jgi:transposase InsO family protein